MQLLNQNEIYENWAPIIESKTGMTDRTKVEWLSKYCHFHSLNESLNTNKPANSGVSNSYMQNIAAELERRFKK